MASIPGPPTQHNEQHGLGADVKIKCRSKVFPWPLGSVHTKFDADQCTCTVGKNRNRPVIAQP